jgi:hypothetical protein
MISTRELLVECLAVYHKVILKPLSHHALLLAQRRPKKTEEIIVILSMEKVASFDIPDIGVMVSAEKEA